MHLWFTLNMKIGVLIPTRNDRPLFMENCLRMLQAQTLQPAIIEIVDDPPRSHDKDITWRYRTGYDRLRGKGLDVIALWENDDWYAPNYLEYMVKMWQDKMKPWLLGTNFTIYYHVKLKAWFKMEHDERASAMNTLIVPDLDFPWCEDNDPYTDLHLWSTLPGITIPQPSALISMGIKHGDGKCGGRNHIDKLERYKYDDKDSMFLYETIAIAGRDQDSFNFYNNYR